MNKGSAVVAGHICLDILPQMAHLPEGTFSHLFQPGHLINVGPAAFSTGGPVSNTGLAFVRLGIPTRLIGKVGQDTFGQIVQQLVESYGVGLSKGLRVVPGETTSYSVIISPPGMDRIFLHCPGANDTFSAEDIDPQALQEASLFHFGYPPLMRRMYQQDGAELAEVFQRAKSTGITTSLDMTLPDPASAGGQADWRKILAAVLPWVDIFLPSVEEITYMLRRTEYEQWIADVPQRDTLAWVTPDLLGELADELLKMGARIVVIKLGARGLYLRTASADIIGGMGRAAPQDASAWGDQEAWAPCFRVKVVGTTGSGDATIAGFLSALLRDFSALRSLRAGVAVGACNVEAADALSGLRSWQQTQERMAQGWQTLPLALAAQGWQWMEAEGVWVNTGN